MKKAEMMELAKIEWNIAIKEENKDYIIEDCHYM